MRLPNGFGSVHKVSGNRRKPYRARKTKCWDEDGRQTYIDLGYFETKSLAIQALTNYNKNPYDIKVDSITFKEVYDKWSDEHFQNIVPSATRTWKSAYKYCDKLYDMRFKDIRVIHLEESIKNAKVGDNTKSRMKSLFNLMYKYALRHEIACKDYASLCNAVKAPSPQIDRTPLSDSSVQLLWDNKAFPFVDMVLIGVYTGFRPQELAVLEICNIDIDNGTFKGGLKTDAGKNRIVPIHDDIVEIVKDNVKKAISQRSKYLFNDENGQQGTRMTYDKYRNRFIKVMTMLNLKHKPHDTRHTFITKAKECDVNEYMLKLMVGHSIQDITEKTYTHRTIEDLKAEMRKLKYTK